MTAALDGSPAKAALAEGQAVPPAAGRGEALDRLVLLLRTPTFLAGAVILLFWIGCALFGRHLVPYDPLADDILYSLSPPDWDHWFGTDQIGRDVFSRVIVGSRDILTVAPLATLVGTVCGTTLGLVAGYFGGWIDEALSRIIEAFLALPLVIVALLALVALGPSTQTVVAVIGLSFTPLVARTVRAAVLSERSLDYVLAAKLRLESSFHIMVFEILPNIVPPILVESTVRLGYAIFAVATLSFIGFGISPPSPDWGLSVAANYGLISGGYWWTVLFDAAAIASLVVGVNLVADGVGPLFMTELTVPKQDADTLSIEGLSIAYKVRGRDRPVVRDLSLRVGRGETYGLVGESGCGKSTVAFAVMRYLAGNGRVTDGRIKVSGRDVMVAGEAELRRMRAGAVSMVYQDPGKALNPSIRVGRQLAEVLEIAGVRPDAAVEGAKDMLARVRIVDPGSVMNRYPHQLSGGMQQRISIAMALAVKPALLILDEPTTGLDVTVEAEVLDLVTELRRAFGTSILFISHNLSVVSQMCERVGVLYAGMLVEEGRTADVFRSPRHPYTQALLRCLPHGQRKTDGRLATIEGGLPGPGARVEACPFEPRCPLAATPCRTVMPRLEPAGAHLARCHFREDVPALAASMALPPAPMRLFDYTAPPLLSARGIDKSFEAGTRFIRALSDVSLDLWPGETIGVVGESGSGKSTLARILLGLAAADDGGAITFAGEVLPGRLDRRARHQVKAIQIVFQNPDSALNRAHSVARIVGRALKTLSGVGRSERPARILDLVKAVRLPVRDVDAKPRRLSGGLKQRVAIARAFAGEPQIVVCDEPTSALDVSVQAAILNLLVDLQAQNGTSYLFISHDLSVVRYISDRILVLYMGRVMEIGLSRDVLSGPKHPYTDSLLSAAPSLERGPHVHVPLTGEMPSALDPPPGCVFHTRCPHRIGPICDTAEPPLSEIAAMHFVRCHLPPTALPGARAALT